MMQEWQRRYGWSWERSWSGNLPDSCNMRLCPHMVDASLKLFVLQPVASIVVIGA